MAVTTWRLRHQNIRSGRSRLSKRNEQADDISRLLNEDPHESFKVVLGKISERKTGEEALLNYLNALVKLTLLVDGKFDVTGLSVEDILSCLRIFLIHDSTQIRSGGMRCIRHVLKTEEDVIVMNKLLIPYLITRCLDLVVKYDSERSEAMKLMRKALILSPNNFDVSMARNLVSFANEITEDKDRMLRICLATLSELGVLNSSLFLSCGGVAAIMRNLLECQTPKIAESLCGVLLLLLDRPDTRNKSRVDLESLAAPFCDFHYKHNWKESENSSKGDERELRLNCSRLALLTILRSWPGILHFCSPNNRAGLKSIVNVLELNQLEVRKAVLDMLYDLLGLPQPEWSDELSVALSAIDPCEPQASWRLNEGFVVAEGRSVLPHLAKTTPCITDIHLSLLLYCFLENGLLTALTEVIATSDTFISVRATVLLGELLRLIQVLLPPECCNISPSLPLLLEYATKDMPQAMGAITALQQLHKLMKRRPASYSLYLDFILRSGCVKKTSSIKQDKPPKHKHSTLKTKLHQFVLKNAEDIINDTGVLLSNDAFTWNWSLIDMLLREQRGKIDVLDSSHRTFIKRLIEFFMPSKNKYSHMDLSTFISITYTNSGIQLIDYLMNLQETEYNAMVLELFNDILSNVLAITSGKSVHDCLFSPQHMVNTQCQSYFLFIGRFAATKVGIDMLTAIDMFNKLEQLATTTNHDCYVKLIISSLDYSTPGPSRQMLEAVLTCGVDSSRLYATQFLLVLLRAGMAEFSKWGVEFLVKQLSDKSRTVHLSALATLNEACELTDCLETLIDLNPNMDHLEEKGMLLTVRFLALESGLTKLNKNDAVVVLIKKWETFFNYRYVKLAEGDISDALTLHQRNEDGKYDKRASATRSTNKKEVFVLPHLYGQLSQHLEGMKLLLKHGSTYVMIECIKTAKCDTDEEILQLKSSLWAIGHMGSSTHGLDLLKAYSVLQYIILLAQHCLVYSIRATAFYVLSLTAATRSGADELFQLGWICTRHNRHDYWPVIKDELHTAYLNECKTFLSDEVMSVGNSCAYDFENIDDDHNENNDAIFSNINSPEGRRVRQLTLPANKAPPVVFHKRSLSESKTFDLFNSLGEDRINQKWGRFRNSSVTESTTSGVSSCDSHSGFRPGLCDPPLSPIPSSSSLSTIIRQIGNFKNNSESSHRISTHSGTNSDVSSSGSYSNRLGFQDLVGYSTIRYLRRFVKNEEGSGEDIPNHIRQHTSFLTPRNSIAPNDLSLLDSSFCSMFSVQKFPINAATTDEEKCYMGICLPQVLTVLFPDSYLDKRSNISLNIRGDIVKESPNDIHGKDIKHNMDKCFKCSQLPEGTEQVYFKEKRDSLKLEVLKSIERLANPVWSKHFKQVLLHEKQKEPELFKDLCMYSQTCSMLSDNVYRLTVRRFIHELFLDVSITNLYDEPKILECDSKKGLHKTEVS